MSRAAASGCLVAGVALGPLGLVLIASGALAAGVAGILLVMLAAALFLTGLFRLLSGPSPERRAVDPMPLEELVRRRAEREAAQRDGTDR